MQTRTRLIAAIAGVTLAAGIGASALALADDDADHGDRGKSEARAAKNVSCKLRLIAVLPPRTRLAENFGTIECGRPLGTGVQHDSSTVTPTSTTAGSFTGPVKQFFDRGTLAGTFAMNYTVAADGGVTYDGTIDLTTGTGRYRGVTGKGTLKGFSPDAVRTAIDERLALTLRRGAEKGG